MGLDDDAGAKAGTDDKTRLAGLVSKRGYVKGSITRLLISINNRSALAELSKEALIVKQDRLNYLFQKYESLCEDILALDDKDKECVGANEDRYTLALTMLSETIGQKTSSNTQIQRPTDDEPMSKSHVRLPAINIPTFTEKQALALENAEPARISQTPPTRAEQPATRHPTKSTGPGYTFATLAKSPPTCLYCKYTTHKLFQCPTFKLLRAAERIKFVEDTKLCKTCLHSHSSKCRFHFKCTVCKGNHNTLLHQEELSPQSITMVSEATSMHVLLPTVRVKLYTSSGTEIIVKALLDSASQSSFVTAELVRLLNLQTKDINAGIIGIGNAHSNIKQSVELEVHSTASQYKIPFTCYVIDQITSQLPQISINSKAIELPPKAQLANPEFDVPSNIHILMGANVFFQVLLPQLEHAFCEPSFSAQHSPANQNLQPYLLNTKFGYVIAGNLPNQCHSQQNSAALFCSKCDSELEDSIKSFWQAESVPEIFPEKNVEFDQCEQIFTETTVFQNNKFQVSLPLKLPLEQVNETLGDSFNLALKRFHNLEKRLQKHPELFKQYKDFIHEYLAQGHGTIVDINKYDLNKDPVYFLAHHAVVRLDKKTTRVRVVFDGSMLTSSRRSLNDLLLNGRVTQRDLFEILLLFRVGEHVFNTDLKSMFRGIVLDPKHRSLQIILWRDSPDENVKCIELNTVTYGLKSSTFLATRCLMELAMKYKDEFPAASFILLNQTYCDDIIVSNSSLNALIEMKVQLIKLLELGGFQAHKWSSNNPEILQDIPPHRQHFDEVDLQKDNHSLKTLGITYDTKTDTLKITRPSPSDTIPKTKREILSYIARLYDPMGLVGPITVSAKVIMQKLWACKLNWDTKLPGELNKVWQEFYNDLCVMEPIHIYRNVLPQNAKTIQLLGYADAASSAAYGCCIYLRIIDAAGNVKVTLVCSKSRVNPLNQELTVPRLELNAALLLAKLVTKVLSALSLKLNISDVFLFTDSKIVLAWVETDITKLNVYVANRVHMIKQHTQNHKWYYVNTLDNPADCLSRGLKPHELQDHPLWWRGPEYLQNSEYCPTKINIMNLPESYDLPETKAGRAGSAGSTGMVCSVGVEADSESLNLDFLEKYSDINKMLRILAYVLRFCNNLKSSSTKTQLDYVTSSEYSDATLLIVKYEQKRHFSEEISLLKQNKPIKGNLRPLNVYLDAKGVLRVGGRLEQATIPFSQKHPAILSNNSHITELLIISEHIKNLHAGPKLTLSSMNQRFWLINGIKIIKKIIHKCLICSRLRAETSKQLMGSLPQSRVNQSRPFQRVGMDFAGPISVKQSRIRRALISKGYICVYVCFTTKAIHLELTSSLTTAAFLASFKRFTSRRGLPSDVYCDNAQTFKSASNQLNELYKLQTSRDHQQQVQSFAAQQGIQFHFIPSYSPVFGGLWEAAVKSSKFHLTRVIQRALLTFEELYTVLAQIESILNSRPLTPMSTDINDYTYLSPGHFLIGTAMNSYPEQDLSETPVNRLNFWNICCSMYQQYWKVWSKQYLSVLQSRPKWRDDLPNVQVGSLVILKELNTKPLYWPMARVVNVFPGPDNKVRAVELRTSNGHVHRRSITKICLLPMDCTT